MKIDTAFSHYYLITSTSGGRPLAGGEREGKAEVLRLDENKGRQERPAEPGEIERAVKEINDYMQLVRRNLEFSVDKDTRRVVVKVIDAESGEVVRQIPPDSVLELVKHLRDKEDRGLLLAQRA